MEKNKAICAAGTAVIASLLTVSLIVVSSRGGIRSTAAKAAFVARVAATVVGHATSDITSSGTTVPPAPVPGTAPGTTAAAPAASATGTTAAGAPGRPAAATASGTTRPPAAGAPATPAAPAAATPTLPPRTRPTAAQVTAAIAAFEKAVPFYTPSAAQIADVGNQVCTDFDHGMTFRQITGKALDMVGAGALSFLIPSSVPAGAVRTLVNLYCPGYTAQLG